MLKLSYFTLIGALSLMILPNASASNSEPEPDFTAPRVAGSSFTFEDIQDLAMQEITQAKQRLSGDAAAALSAQEAENERLFAQLKSHKAGIDYHFMFDPSTDDDATDEDVLMQYTNFLEVCIIKRQTQLKNLLSKQQESATQSSDSFSTSLPSARLSPIQAPTLNQGKGKGEDAEKAKSFSPGTTSSMPSTPGKKEELEPGISSAPVTTESAFSTPITAEPEPEKSSAPAATPEPKRKVENTNSRASTAAPSIATSPDFTLSPDGTKVFHSSDQTKDENMRLIPNPKRKKRNENFSITNLKQQGYIPKDKDTRNLKDSQIYKLYARSAAGVKSAAEALALALQLEKQGR